jgi:hypothetical protein
LWRTVLEVQPTQDPRGGSGVIVLNELSGNERSEELSMESLDEEAPCVAMDVQLNKLKSAKFKRGYLHWCSC